MMNITIFTKYSSIGASSRHRFFNYLPFLLKKGINLEIINFFDTSYLDTRYYSTLKKTHIFLAYFKRFFSLLTSSQILLIEYEIFPKIPYLIESFFLRNKKYVISFDDNIWAKYDNSLFLKNKINKLVKNADGVIVANSVLYNKVKNLNTNIIKIPTAINPKDYSFNCHKFERLSIVWIGTPITYKYVISHSKMLENLAERIDYDLIIIASKSLESQKIDKVNMKFYDWSPETESNILCKSNIGIMPIDSDDFSQGKSAFKIIQYMAAGLPIVASKIGENVKVLEHNKNGFLVEEPEDWIQAITNLYKNNELEKKFGAHSRKLSTKYSIRLHQNKLINFLMSL